MESEGPYRIRKGFNYGVVGPGIPNTEEQYDLTPDIANMIYSEGRKAAEKKIPQLLEAAHADGFNEGRKSMERDFRELLEFANFARLCLTFPKTLEERARTENFDAWKKARGIE